MPDDSQRDDSQSTDTTTETTAEAMTLVDHLRELRSRLIKAVLAVAVAFVFTYTYSEDVYQLLIAPLMGALPPEQGFMAFTALVEPFFTYLKAALVGAFIIASPVVLYQLWAFVAPGLHASERRTFLPLIFFSVVLFFAGIAFAYMVVFPVAFKYLVGFAGPEIKPYLSMGLYFSLATKLLMAFGAAFQLPLVMVVLARLGMVKARAFAAWWRYALLLSVAVGAVLTPPDIFSQLLMGGPLMVLYGIGVLLAFIFGKK